MSISWLAFGAIIALGLAGLWWLRRDNRDLGRSEAERDAQDKALDDVAKANAARDSVRDPAVGERLHDKFDRR